MTYEQLKAALYWACFGMIMGGIVAAYYRFDAKRIAATTLGAFVFVFLLATWAITQ